MSHINAHEMFVGCVLFLLHKRAANCMRVVVDVWRQQLPASTVKQNQTEPNRSIVPWPFSTSFGLSVIRGGESSTRHFSIKMHTICNLNVDFVNAANNSMEWTHMGCLGLWHWLCYRTEMNSLCEVRTCGLSFERVAFEWFRMLWLVWMVRISAAKFCCLAAFYSRRWIVNCIANEINFNGHCLCIRQMLIKHSL